VASHRIPLAVFFMTVVQTVALGQSTNHIYGHDIGLPFKYRVVGAPLTATRPLDYEPAKNSVDAVPVHRDATLYRDSEGRTRTEFNHPGQPLSVLIQDCVAGLYYGWTVGDTAAIRWKIRHVGHSYDRATAPKPDNGKDTVVIEGVPTHHSYRTIKQTGGRSSNGTSAGMRLVSTLTWCLFSTMSTKAKPPVAFCI
jgi:hypothetical protein